MNMRNTNTEIKKLVQEEVGTSVAHHFGLIQEWFSDQFALVHEKFAMLEEKWDLRFEEIRSDLDQVKRNTDTNSLDIHTLNTRVKKLEKTYD